MGVAGAFRASHRLRLAHACRLQLPCSPNSAVFCRAAETTCGRVDARRTSTSTSSATRFSTGRSNSWSTTSRARVVGGSPRGRARRSAAAGSMSAHVPPREARRQPSHDRTISWHNNILTKRLPGDDLACVHSRERLHPVAHSASLRRSRFSERHLVLNLVPISAHLPASDGTEAAAKGRSCTEIGLRGADSKTVEPSRAPRVRIPPPAAQHCPFAASAVAHARGARRAYDEAPDRRARERSGGDAPSTRPRGKMVPFVLLVVVTRARRRRLQRRAVLIAVAGVPWSASDLVLARYALLVARPGRVC